MGVERKTRTRLPFLFMNLNHCVWMITLRLSRKKMPQSSVAEWAEIGVGEDWVPVLRKAGFNLISNIKDEKAQGLQQKIGDIVKKYKLELQKPSVDDIAKWIEAANK